MMRLPFLWLSLVGLFFVQPVLAQDKQQPLLTVPHTWTISGAHWHPNSRDFWTWNRNHFQTEPGMGDYRDHLQLWNGETGKQENQLTYRGDNVEMILDWSAGDNRVLIYSGNKIEIWDALRGETIWTLNNDTGRISGARWNSNFNRILYWSYDDGSIHIWDTNAGKQIFLAETNLPSDVVDAQWSPDEKTVLGVVTQGPGSVQLWDVATGQKTQTIEYPNMVYSVGWNGDGSSILIIGDKVIQLVEAVSGSILNERKDDLFLYRAQWSTNRQFIAVRAENDPVIQIWDSATGKVLSTIVQSGHIDNVISEVLWSKDNQRVLTHSPDGIDIWDATTGTLVSQLSIDMRNAFNASWLSWSPDETKAVVMRSDSSLQIVTLSDHSTVDLELASPIIQSLASPTFTWNRDQSQIMLSGMDNTVRLWDTASGKLLASLQHPTHDGFSPTLVMDALWSPNEQSILTLGTPDYCGGVDSCPTEAMVWQAPH